MDIPSIFTNLWNGIVQLLNGLLDMRFFIPVAICLGLAAVYSPGGPTKKNQLVASYGFGTLAAYLLVLLFRGTPTDAIVFGLIVLATGLTLLCIQSKGWVTKVIMGLLALVTLSSIIAVSASSPAGGFLPPAVNEIWLAARTMWASIGA